MHILLLSIITTLIVENASSADCPEVCGGFLPPQKTQKRSAEKLTRIVNGWKAQDRGFMVLIRASSLTNPEDYETCGGSLLNNRYVLTAGHCVCMQSGFSNVQCDQDGNLFYDPQKVIKVYIGVNDKDIRQLHKLVQTGSVFEHAIDKVIKHENWDGTGSTYPDLALLRLAKPASLISPNNEKGGGDFFSFGFSGAIMPICLPPKDLSSYSEKVFVAGWGQLRNAECFTDDFGPNRHTKCRFPFEYNGSKHKACLTVPSPSSGNKRCQQFKKDKGENEMPKEGESILILYNKRKRKTVCYNERPGPQGWCGVCIKEAQPDQYGYCPPIPYPASDDPYEMTRPKRSRDWGFCSANCKSGTDANELQETGLTMLTKDECKEFDTPVLEYRPDVEVCAANKIPFPQMKVYVRKKFRKPQNGRKYVFQFLKHEKNTLGAKPEHAKLDYYLGNTDSCQGDSGGPLYRFIGNKTYLVGVVSRGDECAGFNQPGIYTDVTKFLDWINENIADGSCKVK